ncbi:MAG: UDP-2,3-diacylglucosamine diphosphatase [Pseudomonadota bacterium]
MTTLFISDLHLEADRPDITDQFLAFLDGEARAADALYILGDLFDAWIGDDDPAEHVRRIIDALRALVDGGTPGFFMHGNRDFLIGARFAQESGFTLLDDPTVLTLYGERVVLMHGDTLCTDDTEYQAFRRMVRDPAWQAKMLALPVAQRRALAAQARSASSTALAGKPDAITDVNADAVGAAFVSAGTALLLHGHTHRPAVHELTVDGRVCTRIVLGPWYEQGSVVRWDEAGYALCELPRAAAGAPL